MCSLSLGQLTRAVLDLVVSGGTTESGSSHRCGPPLQKTSSSRQAALRVSCIHSRFFVDGGTRIHQNVRKQFWLPFGGICTRVFCEKEKEGRFNESRIEEFSTGE